MGKIYASQLIVMVLASPLEYVVSSEISVESDVLRTSSILAVTEAEKPTWSVTLLELSHSQVEPPGSPSPMSCFMLAGLALMVWTPYSNEVS
jgi:hypothetical protein